LTSDEIIGAVLQSRDGHCPDGASYPDRHRLPGVWMDSVGTAGSIIHRSGEADTAAPISAGASPTKAHHLARYSEYIPLQQWETLNQGLSKEVVPVRRTQLRDYMDADTSAQKPPQPMPAVEEASVEAPPPMRGLRTPRPSPQFEASNELSLCTLPPPASTASPALVLEAYAAESEGGSSYSRSTQAAPPATRTAGRMCVGLPRPTLGQARAVEVIAESKETEIQSAQPDEEHIHLQVCKVQPNATAPQAQGNSRLPKRAPPRIQSKDDMKYPTAKEMRPAREKNATSKRRLNELLQLPKVKIDACGQHPSKSFGVVPSQNLRVV